MRGKHLKKIYVERWAKRGATHPSGLKVVQEKGVSLFYRSTGDALYGRGLGILFIELSHLRSTMHLSGHGKVGNIERATRGTTSRPCSKSENYWKKQHWHFLCFWGKDSGHPNQEKGSSGNATSIVAGVQSIQSEGCSTVETSYRVEWVQRV